MLPAVPDHRATTKKPAAVTALINKSASTDVLLGRKSSYKSFSSALSSYLSINHRRLWLFLVVLSLQIAIFVVVRSLPHGRRHLPSPVAALGITPDAVDRPISSLINDSDGCSSGRVYVYDLPSFFNRELIEKCDYLNPWSSSCEAMANGGLGPRAAGIAAVVPENLAGAWFWTDQFVSEIIFHNRIVKHKCRTMEPESATGFYIPFYAGLAVGKYLWSNYSAADRDRHCKMMLRWVQGQDHFRRSNGWNHFVTMGRITWDFRRSKDEDWGSRCIYSTGMRNITRLLIERNPWDYFDVGIPYPTGFHPRSDSDVALWQDYVRTRPRSTLFCFAGAKRTTIKNDFRGLLLDQCQNEPGSCRAVDCAKTQCSNGSTAVLETFLDSKFCLQPRGDSFTRRSIFDCMVAGSIPVLFWKRSAYVQYEWFLPRERESYSVYIDRNEVKNGTKSVREVLEKYSEEDVRRMREKVIEYIPKFVYAANQEGLGSYKDAFDVAIDGVLRRFKEQEKWYKWR